MDEARLREVADTAFETFDFGPGVQILDHDGWRNTLEQVPPAETFRKRIFLSLSGDSDGNPEREATFEVRFLSGNEIGVVFRAEAFLAGKSIGAQVGVVGRYSLTTASRDDGVDAVLQELAVVMEHLLNSSDSEHEDFLDSGADSLGYLWENEALVRQAIALIRKKGHLAGDEALTARGDIRDAGDLLPRPNGG